MPAKGLDLRQARVLVSNDDGIHAPGLKILEQAARAVAREVWVVAPETEQSAASHSLTLRRPLRIRAASEGRYAVDGTPTDSVLLGVNKVMEGLKPDLVLSGVNRGGNLGEDVTYSGTVAAAMEGTLLGIPSIAFSQIYDDQRNVIWENAEHWVPAVLRLLDGYVFSPGVLLNVNLPNCEADQVTGIEITRQGRRKIGGELQAGRDPRGEPYYWVGPQRDEQQFAEGTDLEACGRNAIAVTPLSTDLTHDAGLAALRDRFA